MIKYVCQVEVAILLSLFIMARIIDPDESDGLKRLANVAFLILFAALLFLAGTFSGGK